MMWVWLAAGAGLGSVANAVIYRLPRRLAWWKGRSICPRCEHQLTWRDLVPLLSYLMLGGKCRYCHQPISLRYFLVELVMAVGFAYLSHLGNLSYLGILWVTTVIAVMDWESRLVSEWLVSLWLVVVVLTMNYELITMNLLGAAVAVILIGGIWAISRGKAMGFGDVEIAAVMGLWLGWPRILVALWAAFVAGGVVGGIRVIRRISGMKAKIAFGPFLILGSWIGFLWGERIIRLFFQ